MVFYGMNESSSHASGDGNKHHYVYCQYYNISKYLASINSIF